MKDHGLRHRTHHPAGIDCAADGTSAKGYRTACRFCLPLTLKQKYCFRPFRTYRVCFAFVPLTFDLDCNILFSEHDTTSSLFVSQLQLEVFHAPFVYRISVNPTTFRDEPEIKILTDQVTVLEANERKNASYQEALSLKDDGKYIEAIGIFESLGDYKDSKDRADECKNASYQEALSLQNDGKYIEAIDIFENLGDYKDSKEKVSECKNEYGARYAVMQVNDMRNDWFNQVYDYSCDEWIASENRCAFLCAELIASEKTVAGEDEGFEVNQNEGPQLMTGQMRINNRYKKDRATDYVYVAKLSDDILYVVVLFRDSAYFMSYFNNARIIYSQHMLYPSETEIDIVESIDTQICTNYPDHIKIPWTLIDSTIESLDQNKPIKDVGKKP